MATAIIMPRQGQSVESCIIGKWHISKGDKVAEGDLLFTYETDKATFDEEAKMSGEILEIYFEEGDDVPVLTNVCVIGEKGEDTSEFAPSKEEEEKKQEERQEEPSKAQEPSTIEVLENVPQETGAISPRAKALAKKQVVDLRFVTPTGPKGRVIERDIIKLIDEGKFATSAAGLEFDSQIKGTGIGGRVGVADLSSKPVFEGPESYEEKHTNIRKIIGKSMHESLATMAQLTLNASFDATDILQLRAKMKKSKETGLADALNLSTAQAVPTINDIILYAVSRVIKNHRLCNAHYFEDKTVFFNRVNLGMAVDTPRGLMVPTIFNSDMLSLTQISAEAKSLATQSQKGTISPDLLTGGTFTVTNLGGLGVESFTPVINPPQTCILGVNTITTAVRNVDGRAVPYESMSLSLTFDHRAIDGAPAARFLKDLTTALENFSLLLIG